MGNQAIQTHTSVHLNVAGHSTASGGIDLQWRIFSAKSKLQGHEDAAVWVRKQSEFTHLFPFRKIRSVLDLRKANGSPAKNIQRDPVLIEAIRRDCKQWQRLRHPGIIRISKPLQESATAFMVETEPIVASLANILGDTRNIDDPSFIRRHTALDPLEIKLGIRELCETVKFLHEQANLVHGAISPENIYLTPDGHWKLAGFTFAMGPTALGETETPLVPLSPNMSFDFIAPDRRNGSVSAACDVYSLGCVLYRLIVGECYSPKLSQTEVSLPDIPIRHLVSSRPSERLSIDKFLEIPFLNDILTRTLVYCDHFLEKDDRSKVEFLRQFASAVPQFSSRILKHKILPVLFVELRNQPLIPLILPLIFAIAKHLDKTTFGTLIFPQISTLLVTEEPFQIPLIFLQNLEFIIASSILPFIFLAMAHRRVEVQVAVFSVAPSFASLISYDQLKHAILPRIENVMLHVTNEKIRVKALECYSKFVKLLTPEVIQESIIPALTRLKQSQTLTPAVKVAIIGVCDAVSERAGVVVTGKQLLPFVIPFLVEKEFTPSQMFDQIEEARTTELKRRSSLPPQRDTRSPQSEVQLKATAPASAQNDAASLSSQQATQLPAGEPHNGEKQVSNLVDGDDDDWDDVFTKISNKADITPKTDSPDRVAVDVLSFPGKQSFSQPSKSSNDPFANLSASFSSRQRDESRSSQQSTTSSTLDEKSEGVFRASGKYGQSPASAPSASSSGSTSLL